MIRDGGVIDPSDTVLVPAGWFTMGSNVGPESARPAHLVFVSSFEIDRYEVSNSRFIEYVEKTGIYPEVWNGVIPSLILDNPVVGVLWREADAFCAWNHGRLPTEAEWEKAARGSDERLYPWGNDWLPNRANIQDGGLGMPSKIDSYYLGESPYALLNMIGNIEEWVFDYFDPKYYEISPERDPLGPDKVADHVLRGGSWASKVEHSNTIFRNSSHSVSPNNRVGFRCASDAEK